MRRDLAPEQLGDLLERPLVAVLATFRADGRPLLSPVWHEWRDGGFTVFTGADDVKVRHLRRDARASILLHESDLPYRGIEVRGRATLSSDDAAAIGRRIAGRYLDEAGAASWGDPNDVVIRLVPGVLRAWDFADDFPAPAEA
jgi:PPOX class probable F420-dependent enzyme